MIQVPGSLWDKGSKERSCNYKPRRREALLGLLSAMNFGRGGQGSSNDVARLEDEEEGDDPPSSISSDESSPELSRSRVNILEIAKIGAEEVHGGSKELEALGRSVIEASVHGVQKYRDLSL